MAKVVDARGKSCPYPLMECIKALREVKSGDVVEVLSSDEASTVDIPAWAVSRGHEVVEVREEGGYYRIVIRKR